MKKTLNFVKTIAVFRKPYLLAKHPTSGRFFFIRNYPQISKHIKEGDQLEGEFVHHSLPNNIFRDVQKSVNIRWVNGKRVWGNIKQPQDVNVPRVFTGQMSFYYTGNQRQDVGSKTTFDAVIAGERTATTRYNHIDYWLAAEVGDHIVFEGPNDRRLLVEITKPLHRLLGSGKTPTQWSKLEGWSTQYFHKRVKPKLVRAWQIEYKFLKEL